MISPMNLALPMFPRPEDLGASGEGAFAFCVLGVLAALADADGRLLEDELRIYLESAAELLSVRWRDPAAQYRALAILAQPPKLDEAIKSVQLLVKTQSVALEARRRAGETVLSILEHTPQTAGARRSVAANVIDALQDRDPDHARRLALLGKDDAAVRSIGVLDRLRGGGADAGPAWLVPRLTTVNTRAREVCSKVAWLAEELDDPVLGRAESDIRGLLDDQPYRIVLVGEMKHGKSCLFNAIAGAAYSPVDESHATTATVVELSFGADVSLSGTWLTKEQASGMLDFARKSSSENESTGKWADSFEAVLNMPWFEAGQAIPRVNTVAELRDYLAADGEYARAVRRVQIGAPVDALRSGASLYDTPGLNDLIRPREEIALEEARRADCICFLMNAEKLGTESEHRFLSALAQNGRAMHLLPVLTRVDRLSSDDKRAESARQAAAFVAGCVRGSPISILDVLPINAAHAAEEGLRFAGRKPAPDTDLWRLQNALGIAVRDPQKHERYEVRIEHAVEQLRAHVAAAGERWLERHEARIPSDQQLEEKSELADQLGTLADHYRDHIGRQLSAVRARMLAEDSAYEERIATLKEDVLGTVRAEIDAELQKSKLNDKQAWERFDGRLRSRSVEPAIERFDREQRERIKIWAADLQTFEAKIREDLDGAIRKLEVDMGKLEGLTTNHSRGAGALLLAKEIIDGVNRKMLTASLGAGGALVATGSVASLLAGATSVAAALAAAAPVALVAGAVVGAGWAVMSLMNKESAQKQFLERKMEGARKVLDLAFQDKPLAHQALLNEVWGRFTAVAQSNYAPLIGTSLAMSHRAKVQCVLWNRIRADGRALASDLTEGRLLDSSS